MIEFHIRISKSAILRHNYLNTKMLYLKSEKGL